ncbi:MAG: hypothetical protein JXA87_14835 [Thermoleophilia bacterium]|nr:hypothetical protein [Thermoleophilia bacterium]
MTERKKKAFDCVEMKRRGARILLDKLAGMTRQEELAFWRERTDALRKRQGRADARP